MKTVSLVPAVVLAEGAKPFTMVDFLRAAVEGFPMFGKGVANIRKADRILKVLEAVKADTEVLSFETDDFQSLNDAVAGMEWNPRYSRKYLPFFDALEAVKE
jgi:hypothetical protein